MTSYERILNTLEFKGVDRLAKDIWVLPAAKLEYGESLSKIIEKNDVDIKAVVGPMDHGYTPEYYKIGKFVDEWGSEWTNLQEGVIGEVKNPVFSDYKILKNYVSPKEKFIQEWIEKKSKIESAVAEGRSRDKFIIGGWVSLFERLQYLRGTEDLYCDIALEEEEMFEMIEIVMDFMRTYVRTWLTMDIDAMSFGDDWGTQISLLINPKSWVEIFKPLYQELFDMIHAAGKKVFFHSDGYIKLLYPHFIEMGVDAINSQMWCMGVEDIAKEFAGKITFWGEISRQSTLPNGTPEEIIEAGKFMRKHLFVNGGGFIGQSEINKDVSLENVEAFFKAWEN